MARQCRRKGSNRSSRQRTPVIEGVARDKIAADLSKGVLTVTLPKTAEAQKPTKTIEIKAAP
jgi:HSP20 family protein